MGFSSVPPGEYDESTRVAATMRAVAVVTVATCSRTGEHSLHRRAAAARHATAASLTDREPDITEVAAACVLSRVPVTHTHTHTHTHI